MNITLIPEWRAAWRMVSVQCMTLAAAIQGGWQSLPPNLVEKVPPEVVHWVTLGLLIAGIVGRLVVQPKVQEAAQ